MPEVKSGLKEITRQLPNGILAAINKLSDDTIDSIMEIRLRSGCPLSVNIGGMNMFVSDKDVSLLPTRNAYIVSEQEIEEAYLKICNYSVHTHSDEIKQGFITLKGGHRAGICGTAVYEAGEISAFRDITSINIRASRSFFGCATPLLKWALKGNLLISGPTASGKTTKLRDLARLLSEQYKRVVIIDSRFELCNGRRAENLGPCCDVLSGVKKSDGLDIAVRTLNPEYIILDELGSISETKGIISAMFCGVKVIASIHAGSLQELKSRPQAKLLIKSGAVDYIAQLNGINEPVNVYGVEKGETVEMND